MRYAPALPIRAAIAHFSRTVLDPRSSRTLNQVTALPPFFYSNVDHAERQSPPPEDRAIARLAPELTLTTVAFDDSSLRWLEAGT